MIAVARAAAKSYDCAMRRPEGSAPRGTSNSLEDLYRELAPAVLGYLRGSGAAEPEDLLGDVFVAVIRGLPNCGDDPAAVRRWVFTVAHHRLVDERRRRMTRSRDVAFDLNTNPSPTTVYDEMLNRVERVARGPRARSADSPTNVPSCCCATSPISRSPTPRTCSARRPAR